jgi:beta-xylosidase
MNGYLHMTIEKQPYVTGRWHDTSLAPATRARALLDAMTLEEKIAQLGSSWPGEEDAGRNVAPMQDSFRGALPFDEEISGGLGHLTRPFGTFPVDPDDGRKRLAQLQRDVVAANRFGIPAIAHDECLTGFTAWRATVYPTALAWGATWNPALVERMAAAIGADMAALGVHQGLSPVLDVVRDYRWGRVEETMGEDPYLVSELGVGYVRGLQSSGIIATLKHFAGYAASRGARNHAPAVLGPREFADVILPPFEKAILAGGARSVMNSYADIDGVPPAADARLLTGLLRDTWGFTGTVVSDYWAIAFLASTHHVAADLADAAAMALEAGLDVELPHTLAYGDLLVAHVRRGTVNAATVDQAALRVLTQKAELGLLDPDWDPQRYTVPVDLDSPRNRSIARRLAEESVILLDNSAGLLPLATPSNVAVIGPTADDAGCLFGCYSFPNHVVVNHPGIGLGISAPTILDALRAEWPAAAISYVPGCDVLDGDPSGIPDAAAAAAAADVTVLLVGDRSGMFGHGTSGEGCDVTSLDLPGVQDALARAVLDASDRVVLVVVSGRPYAIGAHAARAAATVQAFLPGEEGGAAIARVLSGRVNPSGRLPVQIPGADAPQPGTYLAPPLALKSGGISNIDPTPAFPFGHGLSYTTFTIDAVRAETSAIPVDGLIRLSATIGNTGARPGTAVPQVYLSDPVASVARPVRTLIGFARVDVPPGSAVIVEFDVHADLTVFTGRDLRRRVEPGRIVLTVAQSAADPGVAVDVDLIGEVRFVGHDRVRSTPHRTAPVRDTP